MDKQTLSRRKRRRRRKRQQRITVITEEPANQPRPTSEPGTDPASTSEIVTPTMKVLARALRMVSFIPMTMIVVGFSLLHFLETSLPEWARPVAENDTAILTVTAGNAAINAILITWNKARGWGSFALLIAAYATYLAGYRSIGDDTVSVGILTILFLSMIPAIFADAIAKGTVRTVDQAGLFVLSPTGRILIMVIVFTIMVAYYQRRDEDYIVNWILKPLGIIVAVLITGALTWMAFAHAPKLLRNAIRRTRNTRRRWRDGGNDPDYK